MEPEIGIFYGSTGGRTHRVALRIARELGPERCAVLDVARASPADLLRFPKLIVGSSTWSGGSAQRDWKAFLPRLGEARLDSVPVAFFGLGDQVGFPGSFADALSVLHEAFVKRGAVPIGSWPVEGYRFTASRAARDGRFLGLALDEANQPEATAGRVARWIDGLQALWAEHTTTAEVGTAA